MNFFLNTNRMRDNQVLKSRVPTIDPSEIYAGLDYQALNQLEGYGILTFRTVEEANSGGLNSESLVVIKGTPNDLPPSRCDYNRFSNAFKSHYATMYESRYAYVSNEASVE
mgnify:CR=1 FL=1